MSRRASMPPFRFTGSRRMRLRVMCLRTARLTAQKVLGLLDEHIAANVGNGVGEGNALGAGLDAVLGEAALLNAAVAGQCAEAVFFEDLACGVVVEELDLGNGGCTHKVRILIELRANFHAAAAGNAV